MVCIALIFGAYEFLACRKEILWFVHTISKKLKAGKRKSNINVFADDETQQEDKPDLMRFIGKTICCSPILFGGLWITLWLAYRPENGYPDEEYGQIITLIIVVISLLVEIIGLLLCCYSRLRRIGSEHESAYTKAKSEPLTNNEPRNDEVKRLD